MNSFWYPLRFKPIYFEKIWGGRDFSQFREDLPEGSLGESWDVACHAHGTSEICNGVFKGLKLDYLIRLMPEEILGTALQTSALERFPLLVKLINSKEALSVQVHPNDSYSRRHEGDIGKTEAWYVIEASEESELVVGTKHCSRDEFAEAIVNGTADKFLNRVKVKKGDVFFIESGLVHAIGKNMIIAEIQQNCDITYRLYDYNRGRELHIKKAMEVIDFDLKADAVGKAWTHHQGWSMSKICKCQHFALELYSIDNKFEESSSLKRFHIITCVEGNGTIEAGDFKENLKVGDSLLIPAAMGQYSICGKLKFLKSFVP